MVVRAFRNLHIVLASALLLLSAHHASAQEAPNGWVPRVVQSIPLQLSGSVRDGEIVPGMKIKNKLIVGNDKRLAYRVVSKAVTGFTLRKDQATLRLVSRYIVSSVRISSSAPGVFSLWDNEPDNTPIAYHIGAGESVTVPSEWYTSSRWVKFSWSPDESTAVTEIALVVHGFNLARAQDYVMPEITATPTPVPPIATPTPTVATVLPTATPTSLPSSTPTLIPTVIPTQTPTRTSTPQTTITATPTVAPTVAGCPGFVIEGFGKGTTGGCGGTVYTVTSLEDPATPTVGTFRYYIQNVSGPRIIKFAVAGTIVLRKDVKLLNGNVTIDGSSAPAGGVQISNGTLIIGDSNVIVRHIRYLIGPYGPNPSSADNIRIAGDRGYWVENVVIDHCSMEWAVDENFSIVDKVRNVTVQWSILAEGLYKSTHNKDDPHSMGALFHHEATDMTFHHNLFAHNNYRNPQLASNGLLEWTNNVVYNMGSAAGLLETQALGDENWLDAVGNYNKMGPNSDWAGSRYRYSWKSGVVYGVSHLFVQGNIDWNRPNNSQGEHLVVAPALWPRISPTRYVSSPVAATSAEQAYQDVLNNVGATLPCRSPVDTRIIQETRDGTGSFLNFPEEHGGWPDLKQGC